VNSKHSVIREIQYIYTGKAIPLRRDLVQHGIANNLPAGLPACGGQAGRRAVAIAGKLATIVNR